MLYIDLKGLRNYLFCDNIYLRVLKFAVMTISIIIPTLNEEKNISSLLSHLIKNRTEELIEIIVVDAKSKDQTKSEAIEHDIIWLESVEMSRAVQMNLGAKKAKGDILYFVHADTIPPKTFCSDIIQAVGEGFDLGAFRFKFDSTSFLLKVNSWFTRFNLLTFRGGDQTLFILKTRFHELNFYNESYSIMEEYDLLIRAEEKKYKFKLMPKDVSVSDRKYENNSYLRVNIANLIAMKMFKRGYDPDRIKRMYFKMLKHPKSESI